MEIITSVSGIRNWSAKIKKDHPLKKIGLVPTMGSLHEGHLTLIRKMQAECDITAVSIFVNPIQFNNPDDLKKYPRNNQRDTQLLGELNVDALFMPEEKEIYSGGYPEIFMDYPKLCTKLCGASRPGHFSGVMVIVHNLFQWLKPDAAIFGLKDYQQYLIIKKMTRDLQLPVEILSAETVRESDGLAMSSRNLRLSAEERRQALIINQTLFLARNLLLENPQKTGAVKTLLWENFKNFKTDYASLYDAETLEEVNETRQGNNLLIAAAVHIGQVRLIDNILLKL